MGWPDIKIYLSTENLTTLWKQIGKCISVAGNPV